MLDNQHIDIPKFLFDMYSTEAIMLKKNDIGEADALFTLYTKDFGKMRALAKGIKKEGAKLRGHLEPLSYAAISFVLGKNGERLTHAELRNYWSGIRNDLRKMHAAYRLAEIVDQHCFPGEKDNQLWNVLIENFLRLEKLEKASFVLKDFLQSFRIEFLNCQGLAGEKRENLLYLTLDSRL